MGRSSGKSVLFAAGLAVALLFHDPEDAVPLERPSGSAPASTPTPIPDAPSAAEAPTGPGRLAAEPSPDPPPAGTPERPAPGNDRFADRAREAIELGRSGELDRLAARLEGEPSPEVRCQLVAGLRAGRSEPWVQELLLRTLHEDPAASVRSNAALVLGEAARTDDDLHRYLVERFETAAKDERLSLHRALASARRTDDLERLLRSAERSEDPAIREAAILGIGRIAPRARVPGLEERLAALAGTRTGRERATLEMTLAALRGEWLETASLDGPGFHHPHHPRRPR